jgi:hypothetical protein
MGNRLAQHRWRTDLLAGGDFESLDQLLVNGWQQHRSSQTAIDTDVELSFAALRSGRSALRMIASARGFLDREPIDEWPIVITSNPIPVTAGQFVRIQGWVNIPRRIENSADGLLVYDSAAGHVLGHRFQETDGWQLFTIYRAATHSGDMTVTFALTGAGEVWLDEVSVAILE